MDDYIIYNNMMESYQNELDMIQEGRILDEAIGKDKNESKVVKILKFIPRLIRAIIRVIKQKLLNKEIDMMMRGIESKLKDDNISESYYIETPVFSGFDKDVKDLHKYSGQFVQFSNKLYDDSQDMMFNMRGLINMKNNNSTSSSSNKFSREWSVSKIYMTFMSNVDMWTKKFVKYDTNKSLFDFYTWDKRDTEYNKKRSKAAFYFMGEIRWNLNEASEVLNKTENLINKNELDMMIANLNNKVEQTLLDMAQDIMRCCRCLSVVASKLAEITNNTIRAMYNYTVKEV